MSRERVNINHPSGQVPYGSLKTLPRSGNTLKNIASRWINWFTQTKSSDSRTPLRDFLFPAVGHPEGLYFATSARAVNDIYGVGHGDVLQLTGSHGEEKMTVVGSRGAYLWVIWNNSVSERKHQLAFPLTSAPQCNVLSVLGAKLIERNRSLDSVKAPVAWNEETLNFLMHAPDLEVAVCATKLRCFLSPVVMPSSNPRASTIVGWSGENQFESNETSTSLSASLSVAS